MLVVVGGCRSDDVNLVVLDQHPVGLDQTGFGFAVVVGQRREVDVDDGALASFLTVVDPSDDG